MPSNGRYSHTNSRTSAALRTKPNLFDQNMSVSLRMIILSSDASIVFIWNSLECFREDE